MVLLIFGIILGYVFRDFIGYAVKEIKKLIETEGI
jgi:hypothetical protein